MDNLVEKVCSFAVREVKDTFSFIWKIQYRQEDQIRYVESSPLFPYFLPETFWSLSLFQNGMQTALILKRYSSGPHAVVIDFELSLLTLGDLPQCVRVCRNHTFLKGDQYCYDDFLRIDDERVKCVPLWFPNNSLTLRCRIWQAERVIHPTSLFISTVFIKDRTTIDWYIKNFTKLRGIPCYSAQFTSTVLGPVTFKFHLVSDPKNYCPTHVKMELKSIDMRKVSRLLCTISTQAPNGKLKNRITEDCPLQSWYTSNFVWDFPYAINRYDARTFSKAYFPDDTLHLRIEFEFTGQQIKESYRTSSHRNFGNSSSSENESSASDVESSPSDDESSPSDDDSRNLGLEFRDSTSSHGSFRTGNFTLGHKDSAVGDSALVQKISTSGHENSSIGNSTLGHEDSVVGDSALGHKDSDTDHGNFAIGNFALGHKDSAVDGKESVTRDTTFVNKDSAIGYSAVDGKESNRRYHPHQ